MSAQIIDGNALAAQVRREVAARVQRLYERGVKPNLCVILVGDNSASQVYVRNKVADSQHTGLTANVLRLVAQTSQQELTAHIRALNADPRVHGILVQLPLPAHLNTAAVIETIDPRKDVDGFHVVNQGALLLGQKGFRPCTPSGVMRMLASIDFKLRGKNAVVLGRSLIVGKPMALMLLEQSATVTVCHSATQNLAHFTQEADLVVCAVGQRDILTGPMCKRGAVVIDVGMNRNEAGALCGDAQARSVMEVASAITPVPGGVGPMTRAMLLVNTLEAAELAP